MATARILIVDDDEDTAGFLRLLLEEWGYEAAAVNTASDALSLVSLRPFDVALIDNRLRDGSGHDLLGRMRSIRPIVAIAVTGTSRADLVRAGEAAGFDEHLVKPLSSKKLRLLLDRFLGVSQTASSDIG